MELVQVEKIGQSEIEPQRDGKTLDGEGAKLSVPVKRQELMGFLTSTFLCYLKLSKYNLGNW